MDAITCFYYSTVIASYFGRCGALLRDEENASQHDLHRHLPKRAINISLLLRPV